MQTFMNISNIAFSYILYLIPMLVSVLLIIFRSAVTFIPLSVSFDLTWEEMSLVRCITKALSWPSPIMIKKIMSTGKERSIHFPKWHRRINYVVTDSHHSISCSIDTLTAVNSLSELPRLFSSHDSEAAPTERAERGRVGHPLRVAWESARAGRSCCPRGSTLPHLPVVHRLPTCARKPAGHHPSDLHVHILSDPFFTSSLL